MNWCPNDWAQESWEKQNKRKWDLYLDITIGKWRSLYSLILLCNYNFTITIAMFGLVALATVAKFDH